METRVQEIVGLNPSTGYRIDIFSHYIVVKLKRLIKKSEINEKEAGDGPF